MVTTPIGNLQSNISPRGSSGGTRYLVEKQFPEPENLNEYYAIKKQPYAFDFFNVGELKSLPTYQKYAEYIDTFVRDEIYLKSLTDSFDTYHDIIGSLLSNLNLDKNTIGIVKMERLYKWIKGILLPRQKIDKRKKELLKKGTIK